MGVPNRYLSVPVRCHMGTGVLIHPSLSRALSALAYLQKNNHASSVRQNGVFSSPVTLHTSLYEVLCKSVSPVLEPNPWICFRSKEVPISRCWVFHTCSFLFQLHWGDYSSRAYLTALEQLRALQQGPNRLITALGLCNFDSARTDEICSTLGPGAVVSNQVQVSKAS